MFYIHPHAQGSKPLSRSLAPSALTGEHVTLVAAQLTLENVASNHELGVEEKVASVHLICSIVTFLLHQISN